MLRLLGQSAAVGRGTLKLGAVVGRGTLKLGAVVVETFSSLFDVPLFAALLVCSTAPAEKAAWVSREAVERVFGAYLRSPPGQTFIVAGPMGTGKSFAAVHAVRGARGVAYVRYKGQDELSKQLLGAVGMPNLARNKDPNLVQLACMCEAAARLGRWRTGDENWLPTIVVEVDSTMTPGLVKDAVVTLKYLAHETRACRAILVLTDASAALRLKRDKGRQTIFWLGDFSRAEAHEYLDVSKLLVGEGKLREAVLDVTTRPSELFDLCRMLSGAPPEASERIVREFVEDTRKQARIRVALLLKADDSETSKKVGLHFRRLLKDMIKNSGSLPEERAACIKSPEHAAECFKKHAAIMYDLTADEYGFNTPADMHAAAQVC